MAINLNAKTTGVGGLETSADNSGEINIQSGGTTVMSVTSSGVAVTGSFSQNGAVYSTQPSFRNLIINGDMRIDQRNAGTSVTPTNASFVTDRFRQLLSVASKYTGQQVTDAPNGFTNSLKLTSSSAYTVGAAEVFGVEQRIEGNNIAHLNWGTANAKAVTLSFWVKSSLTGTLSGAISNNTDAAYPFDYTISSANTWEKKTINISGPTIGTWLTTNGVGIAVKYMIGIDPTGTWANTPDVWTGANEFGATTQNVDIVGTSGATWQITGVQLEVGSTATDFENLPFDIELKRCSRYYQKTFRYSYAPYTTDNDNRMYYTAMANASTVIGNPGVRPIYQEGKMRTAPTITLYDTSGNSGKLTYTRAGQPAATNITAVVDQVGENAFRLSTSSASSLTAGQAVILLFYYTADAEL